MPTDFLLPAFALTLLANAVLVALAVRGLLRARSERRLQDESSRARLEARPAAAAATRPLRTARPPIADVPSPALEKPQPAPAKPATKRPRRPPPATKPPPDPKPRNRRRTGDDGPRAETRRGGRRRFSLPPLDEDHERINRSIETFLSGSEGSETSEAGEATELPSVATTVAIVAIDGLDAAPSHVDREAVDGVVATVERELRGAARSADRVTPVGTGRFRVVLPSTGELAARAYLRRVRATVGPSLAAADAPLGLVTATATVLDDTVSVAVAQAEARLDAAMASAARRQSAGEPRVAAD